MGYNAMVVQPDFPTPQTVWVRSNEPRIQMQLTGLDQFYSNVQYNSNQNYCYYQISYFDVPQIDDVIKILQNKKLVITVKAQTKFEQLKQEDGTYLTDTRIQAFQSTFDLPVLLETDLNAESLALKIRQALFFASQIYTTTWANSSGQTANGSDQYNTNAFFAHFSNFIFDPVSQKYAVIYKPPLMVRWNFMPDDLYLTGTYTGPVPPKFLMTALSMTMTIDPGRNGKQAWSKKQLLLLSNMFGVDVPANGVPLLDFSMGVEPARTCYYELVKSVVQGGIAGTEIDLTFVGRNAALDAVDHNYMYKLFSDVTVYSPRVPKFITDNYVYVNSTAATNMWSTDGKTLPTIAIIPRNRAFGQQVSPESAYFTNSTMIKAPINSVRSMQLTFTDRDGTLLDVVGEYIVAITIHFNLALPKD